MKQDWPHGAAIEFELALQGPHTNPTVEVELYRRDRETVVSPEGPFSMPQVGGTKRWRGVIPASVMELVEPGETVWWKVVFDDGDERVGVFSGERKVVADVEDPSL